MVIAQDADGFITVFPPVDPAIFSEYGINEQVIVRISEGAFAIDVSPGRKEFALFYVKEEGIPCLQYVSFLIQAMPASINAAHGKAIARMVKTGNSLIMYFTAGQFNPHSMPTMSSSKVGCRLILEGFIVEFVFA